MLKFFILIYKITHLISPKIAYTLRFFLWRKSVLEPPNLKLLYESETAYFKSTKTNKKVTEKIPNKVLRIGFVGQISQSMTLSKNFWDHPPNDIDIFIYEILAEGYTPNPKLRSFNHSLYKGFWFEKSKINRVFKDTFEYELMAKKINSDNLDILLVTIESIGRFTYGKLFDQIITDTKIILTQPGNYFNVHPKIDVQSQMCLPMGWKIKDNSLTNYKGYEINEYKFIDDLFMYDKRDIIINEKINKNFNKIIFVHGRLSYFYQIDYLELIAEVLSNDIDRKFFFMGIDDKNCLNSIIEFFENKNLRKQIKYLGFYEMKFNEKGVIDNQNWLTTKKMLKNSCVFIDPFPKGTGSSRIEAFISGLPVIDMDIEDVFDINSPIKKEYNISSTIKKSGAAKNHKEYLMFIEKVFNDMSFREKIIKEQYKIANKFVNEKVVWNKLLSYA